MAVSIRLRRGGKRKQAQYRIVAADSRFSRDGRFLEILGHYNPHPEQEEVVVKRERLVYWLKEGAKPTDTVKSLFKRKGIWADVMAEVKPTAKKKTESQSAPAADVAVAEQTNSDS